ncbi:MAG: AI-2E family transporter [Planctomycetota bacterium]|nr:MAG: AI-2E family transporter [Planctomycetota bacterium]
MASDHSSSSRQKPSHQPPEEDWYRVRLWQIQAVRDVLLVLAVWAVLWLGFALSVVTVPLLIGLGLAYLVEPFIVAMSTRFTWATRPRLITGLVAVLVIGGTLVSLLTVPRVVGQAMDLVRNRAVYADHLQELLSQEWVPEGMREHLGPSLSWLASSVGLGDDDYDLTSMMRPEDQADDREDDVPADSESPDAGITDGDDQQALIVEGDVVEPVVLSHEELRQLVRMQVQEEMAATMGAYAATSHVTSNTATPPFGGQLGRVAGTLVMVFGNLVNAVLFVFLTIFFFVFMSLAFPRVVEGLWSITPVNRRERLHFLANRMDAAVSGFVRGRLLICLFMAVGYGIGWTVFGVPHALVLALVTGILGLIPFAAAAMLPVAIILVAVSVGTGAEAYWYRSGESDAIRWWAVLLLPSVVFAVVQIMDDYVLTPIIQGKTTNLDVVSIVVAVIAGGSLAGVYGMLLAIPVAACLRILWLEVALPAIRDWSEGRRVDPLPVDNKK